MAQDKADAFAFLEDLERAIAQKAPKGTAMEREVRRTIKEAKTNPAKKHLGSSEAAFINSFVIPVLFDQILKHRSKLTNPQAREALLSESHGRMPEFSAKSPSRAKKHPFEKIIGDSPESIYSRWSGTSRKRGPTQSCPDFALTHPFPHRVVFEGKYFASGSKKTAESKLVKDIYQAFFYRGLPQVDATKRNPEWNYDYACLLGFDASPEGSLKSAWDELDKAVRESFWEGGNIYVMILGGGRGKSLSHHERRSAPQLSRSALLKSSGPDVRARPTALAFDPMCDRPACGLPSSC